MGRAVLTDADGVVREDVYNGDFHQSGQADRGACVVAEDEEAGGVGADFAECQDVGDGWVE